MEFRGLMNVAVAKALASLDHEDITHFLSWKILHSLELTSQHFIPQLSVHCCLFGLTFLLFMKVQSKVRF